MPALKLIDGDGSAPAPAREEALPDAEAFDAYSRTVSGVAERLRPSVAHLAVARRTRRGRREGGGSAVARAAAARSRSRPTATCSPRPTSSPPATTASGPRSPTGASSEPR